MGTTDILRQALRSARVSVEQLAIWARLDVALLRDAEAGRTKLTAAQLDRVACVFGLRFEDLLEGKAGTAPMTLLLRSGATDASLDIRSVLTTEIDQALGEFQRVVRDVADIEALLDSPRPALPQIPDRPLPPGAHPGEPARRPASSMAQRDRGVGEPGELILANQAEHFLVSSRKNDNKTIELGYQQVEASHLGV